ncbi:major royal jelly protein 1-like [Ctenocephalides felis]|uniref:major royal jelly protein 1-like n=1 Tax=Ctenocephalides felis TaxID=7515 RepID=UPI000E6E4EFF|nr:major royal jelly protein 1-like [Ctenocephalides felis]
MISVLRNLKNNLKLVHEWRELEFAFPSRHLREYAISNGLYERGASLPIDVAVDYKENGGSRIFVTIPRFSNGVPMTLTTVTRQQAANGPMLAAYPDYSWHSSHGRNCNGLTSVFRVDIDKCNRMWVLDTGMIGSTQHCPPQLVVFNLHTDKMIMRYRFPEDQYKSGISLFVTPVVDVQDSNGKCSNTFVYIGDVTGQGLVVFDLKNERSWRINNKLFYPNPEWGTFTIQGESFDLMDGIVGMALTPQQAKDTRFIQNLFNHGNGYNGNKHRGEPRTLYFHALASNAENMVTTDVLLNSTMWTEDPDANPRLFETIGKRDTQSAAQAIDNHGNLFFGLVNPQAIACWDTSTPYEPQNLITVAENPETLQFASGVKVINNLIGGQELWVMTNSIQKFMTGSINNETVNFRIQALQTEGLLGPDGRCTRVGRGSNASHGRASGYAPLIFN